MNIRDYSERLKSSSVGYAAGHGVYMKGKVDVRFSGMRTKEIMAETCEQMDSVLLEFGGEDDHIHMMISAHPKIAVSNLVSKLKGKSAYMMRREFWARVKTMLWGNHFWSPSYCVVSCGGASLDVVKEYITNQRTPPKARDVARSRALRKVN